MENLKIFDRGDYRVIFNGKDMTLKVLPLKDRYPGGAPYGGEGMEVPLRPPGTGDPARSPIDRLVALPRSEECCIEEEYGRRPFLHRLSLNVSNLCNMACRYCYANGGPYYTSGMLMDRNTALNSVNFTRRSFSKVELLNFFGGEPTLNEEAIELTCEYFLYLRSKEIIPYLPRFGLTTNGYVLSNRMLHIMRSHNFGVCVSLDGPKDIHDQLRVRSDGTGTYDAISKNVETILDMGIIPEFECTYTAEHLRKGIDLVALMDFFYDTFGNRTLHCPMVSVNQGSEMHIPLEDVEKLYTDAIRYSVHNLMRDIPNSISTCARYLNSLVTATPIGNYCPAGKSSLTINADGNIYACFMLMQGTGFSFGNVNSESPSFEPPDAIGRLLSYSNKWQNPACQECWAQPLCFGCLGEDIAREGFCIRRSAMQNQSELCDLKRRVAEVFLTSVADAATRDPKQNGT